MINNITIFGLFEHSKTSQLLRNVEVALKEVDSPVEPICITSLDEFIRLQLAGIPALQLNGEIVSEKRVLTVAEIIVIFQTYIPD